MKKIGIITSKGGHLIEILQIMPVLKNQKRFWVSFKGDDVSHYLRNEKVYFGYFPENRNIINFFKNFFLSIIVLIKEKPQILISTGAGIAVPFFITSKFFGVKLIYIEPSYFVNKPSLTGRLIYNITDFFVVQNNLLQKWYPKAISVQNPI